MHPNYQALIDYSIGSLSSQGKFPLEQYKYICEDGTRCIIGLLLPERIISTMNNRSIGYGEVNKEALEYISITFGLPNNSILSSVLTSMQSSFDNSWKDYKHNFNSFLTNYREFIEPSVERITKHENFSV